MNILNIITQLLAYSDATVSDNPQLRNIDWTRRISGIAISKPEFDTRVIAPGESHTIFDGSRTTSLSGSSVLEIELLSPSENRYRVTATSGPSGFRTARSVSGIVGAVVTVNNNSVATFAFSGATLTGVIVGDILRVKGQVTNDTGPFAFSPTNAGLWKIIGVSGSTVQAVRLVGQSFSGVNETVATATADVSFYSSSGVQVGDTVDITGTFSMATHRAYQISDVTPDTFDLVSAMPLPEETVTYVSGSIAFYVGAKKLVYVEVDQDAVVRFNEDESDNNRVNPIIAGESSLVGYLHKYGTSYRVVLINKSINSLNVKYFLAE